MTDTAPDEAPTVGRPALGRTRRLGVTAVLAGLVALLVVAALVLSLVEWSDANSKLSSDRSLHSSALAAANQYGVLISSYDYNDLNGPKAAWTQVDRDSTAAFRNKFDSTKASIAKLVTDYKGTATGKVVEAGIASVDGKSAVAVLFIDQTLTNSVQKTPSTEPLRVVMKLSRQGGRWLIGDVEVPK